jgi:hypothetical protein
MIQCAECGKFIAYKELENKNAETHFDPEDTNEVWHIHKKCNKGEINVRR